MLIGSQTLSQMGSPDHCRLITLANTIGLAPHQGDLTDLIRRANGAVTSLLFC